MILLDLFSGIGNFHAGLTKAGFSFKKVYFSEIEKYPISNYTRNFPNAEYVGSVTDIRGSDIERPNIITFGSPCQDFSLAGKRKGMDGERSSLISEAIRLITETRPDVFIWENVKGTFSSNDGEDFWAIIKAFTDIGGYRLEWQLLNTSWFLPQNRERIYLVGTLATSRRSSGDIFPIREKSSRSKEGSERTTSVRCLTAGGNSGGMHSSMTLIKTVATINSSQDGKVFCESGHSQTLSAGHGNVPKVQIGTLRTHKDGEGFRETSSNLCPTIPARAREDGSGQPCVAIGAIRGRNPANPKSRESGLETQQMLEINDNGTSNCLTTVQKDNVVVESSYSGVSMERTEEGKQLRKDYESGKVKHGFNEHRKEALRKDGLTNTIDTNVKSQKIGDGVSIRRLTEIECERLQGCEDDFTKYGIFKGEEITIPATARYKMLGNSVSRPVVKAVGERILEVMNF